MRHIMAGALIVGMALALLWHFSCIWRFGEFPIQEPNRIILWVETVFLFGILSFGSYYLYLANKEGTRRIKRK